jgi:hypothetical protein
MAVAEERRGACDKRPCQSVGYIMRIGEAKQPLAKCAAQQPGAGALNTIEFIPSKRDGRKAGGFISLHLRASKQVYEERLCRTNLCPPVVLPP